MLGRIQPGRVVHVFLLLILIAMITAGCSLFSDDEWQYAQTPIPPPEERNGKPLVMIVGDSIAAGWEICDPTPCGGIERDWWQGAIGDQAWVFNRGVGNSTTADLLERWQRDTKDADYIIILTGINDAFHNVSSENIIKNLESMYRRAIDQGTVPIIATILPFNSDQQTPYVIVEQVNAYLVNQEDWLILDLHTAFEDPENPDHARPDELATALHPNAKGYARLTDYVREWWTETSPSNR